MNKKTLSQIYNQDFNIKTYHDGGLVGDGGDDCLYLGMMSAVNPIDPSYSDAVKACQSANGQLWRNPLHARNAVQYKNSYSKDMLSGFLLGVISNPDLVSNLQKFIKYLRKNKGLMFTESSDGRNKTNAVTYAMFIRVLRYHKVSHSEIFKIMGASMYLKGVLVSPVSRLVTGIEGLYPRLGFQAHLVAVQLFAMKKMGFWGIIEQKTAEHLVKLSPGNGFFQALAGHRSKAIALLTHTIFHGSKNLEQKSWPYGIWQVWLANRITSRYAGIFLQDYIRLYCTEESNEE